MSRHPRTRVQTAAATVVGLLLGAAVVAAPPAHAAPGDVTVVAGGNGPGSALDQLRRAEDVAVDTSGNVYVADRDNHRVLRWAPGATSGVVVAGGHGSGADESQLSFPEGVALDGAGNVLVADRGNNRVVRWAPGASEGVVVAGGNGSGSQLNQLAGATGIDVDSTGNVYVSDLGNNRVVRWAPGATTGVLVAGGDVYGPALNQLDSPTEVAVDAARNVYISEWGNRRVTRWAPGASTGVLVAGGNPEFERPVGLAVDGHGNVYVSQDFEQEIVRWAPGASVGVVVGDLGANQSAQGLDVRDGFLYASDSFDDVFRVELPGPQGGVTARVAILEEEGPCLRLQGTAIDFGSVQFGEQSIGDANTAVTNCGSQDVALHARVSEAVGATASWEPLAEDRPATCADGVDLFSYELTDPIGTREELGGRFLDTRNVELDGAFAVGASRVDEHTLHLPCTGSSGAPDEVVSMTVVFTATEA